MPTVSETLLAIRGAAATDRQALASVKAAAVARLALVEAWTAGGMKGRVRDQLGRLIASYGAAGQEALDMESIAHSALTDVGAGADPNPPGSATTWSTGDW